MGADRLRGRPGQAPSYLNTLLIPEEIARAEGELLKQTRSLCPTCLRELDAEVYAVREQVWLYKECPHHGPALGLVERDVGFYRALMNQTPAPKMDDWWLVLPVTHRCNLSCSICFVPKRDREDLDADELIRIVEASEVPWIVMSGGEPTLREDLPELIRRTRRAGKNVGMNTNGVLLADRGYVERLAEAGLQYVLLSFNGIDDAVYERINGRPLYGVKRRALQNLVDLGIETAISPTVMRGVNEDLSPLVELCFKNAPVVEQLRVRGAAHVGTYGDFEPLVMSELLSLFAPTVGRTVDQLLDELDPSTCYHSVYQWNMDALFFAEGQRAGELYYWDPGEYCDSPPTMDDFLEKVRRELGEEIESRDVSSMFTLMAFQLWYWPDRFNIDLEEIKAHGVLHLYDNSVPINFLQAVNRAHEL